jgi:hypothetical protein
MFGMKELSVVPLVVAGGAGAASRHSLGTAVFGSMTAATVLGIFAIPLLYVLIQRLSEKFAGKTVIKVSESGAQVHKPQLVKVGH